MSVGEFLVCSCNHHPPPFAAGWSSGALRKIDEYRAGGREEKGRILYGIFRPIPGREMVVAALCYHLEKAGHLRIQYLGATGEMTDHRARMFQMLTLAADWVALATTSGKHGKLEWQLNKRSEDARFAREVLRFSHAGAPAKNQILLRRVSSAAAPPPVPSERRPKPRT